jgi:hypothetical protein
MVDGNLDLSIRMKHFPELKTEGKKQVDIEVKTSLGVILCTVKSKAFRKIEQAIKGFSHDYVVMISGKEIEKEGSAIRLTGCGLQVFEKKPKEEKTKPEISTPPAKEPVPKRVYIPNSSVN